MQPKALIVGAATAALLAVPCAAGPPRPTQEAFRLRMSGHSDDAIAHLEKAIEQDAEDAGLWYELARVQFYHIDMEQASQAIERAVELAPENATYHAFHGLTAAYRAVSRHHGGDTSLVVEDLEQSMAAFERALALDPSLHDARLRLIELLVNNPPTLGGNRSRAEELADGLVGQAPAHEVAARCLLLEPRHRSDCITQWRDLLEREPTNAKAHAGLALAYVDAGDLDLAAVEAEAAILLEPSESAALLAVGRAYGFADDDEPALVLFRKYLEIQPAPPAALRAHAQFMIAAVTKRSDRALADRLLEKARATDPHVWTTMREPPAELFTPPVPAGSTPGKLPMGEARRPRR